MDITNIVVHEIIKDEDGRVADVRIRSEENEINDHAIKLVEQLNKLFSKGRRSFGKFSELSEGQVPPLFVSSLSDAYQNSIDPENFYKLSIGLTHGLKEAMTAAATSRGGYVMFIAYKVNNQHFFNTVLLRKKQGMQLDDDLSIQEIEELDLDKLHMAARINITRWQSGEDFRYICFQVGTSADDVTNYFLSFVGCEDHRLGLEDTKNLVHVTRRYCELEGFSAEVKADVKKEVLQFCTNAINEGLDLDLERLSKVLDASFCKTENANFLKIAQADEYGYNLNGKLQLIKKGLKGLKQYYGTGKGVHITFTNQAYKDGLVAYNQKSQTLVIKELPPALLRQLEDEKGTRD